MHRRRASVVPICSQPFEPTFLIGRDPSSLSSGRKHRESIGSDSIGSGSGNSSSSSSSANLSQSVRGRRAAFPTSDVDMLVDEVIEDGEDEVLDASHFYGDVGASASASGSGSESATSSPSPTSSFSSTSSSGMPSPSAVPELFEAHLQYSRTLFTHTTQMWQADRLAIERSREGQSTRETVARIGQRIGILRSTSATSEGRRRRRSASDAANKPPGSSNKTKTHRRGRSEKS
ncbi:unnamed protein product [Tilletia controversa]|uniref:Uncharacterized protein n=3 Tax=Tilletia TaxID=13289 RepID=A0A8X7MMS7_9BASI|nr:hypothetical protein CF336_g6402 [Tilletia laevis]KAE8199578.1 hypothetical protein CF328_g3206 [Tilletia controversa]KAE8254129.1 hypothetical protein A4X03_0g5762 [Tilletia caries]KAE8192905.1 hypothetical protein CF335_g5727 [Tilletia laevis]KAE8242400.1 hypothetical protein A4X06_0g6939 [Tilletia controversa]